MKSDIIRIDNLGNGFDDALLETKKTAVFRGLQHKQTVQLQLLTEEMLTMISNITGEVQASFWLETVGGHFDLSVTTQTVMDSEKRSQLIASSTSQKNEAANSFLGKLRNAFEQAMTAEPDYSEQSLPFDVEADLVGREIRSAEWDRFERSVLFRLADGVKVNIRGGMVLLIVSKDFEL